MRNRFYALVPHVLAALLLLAGPAHADDDGESSSLAEHLRTTKITVMVEEMSFSDVIDVLRTQTGLNILIDPRIRADVGDVPVTALQVNDIALETVFNLLKSSAGESVTWFVQDGVVVFTAYEFVPTQLDVRIYSVASLVTPRTAFVAPHTGLLERTPDHRVTDPVLRYGSADELIELIMGAVKPEFWEETEGAAIRTLGEERLVVKATPAVHEAILAFCAQLEDRGPDAILVEIHTLAATDFPTLASNEVLTDETAGELLARSPAGPSLCLAVRDGVSSTAFAGTRRAYVAAYEPRLGGGPPTQDPRVDTQELGLAVRVRAVSSGGDGRILLKLGVAVAEALNGSPSNPPDHPDIDLPGLVSMQRESTMLLVPGRWHLAEGRTGGADAGRTAFLVRATPVESERDGPSSATPFVLPTPEAEVGEKDLSQKRVKGLQWENANLDVIVTYLRTISGLNFFIAPRVRAEVYEEIEISLNLDDVSLRTVLDLVTEPYELQWTLRDGLVVINQRGDRGPHMRLRYYDVKDLTERIVQPGQGLTPSRTTDGAPAPLYPAEALVDLIRESIATYESWEDPAAIEARNGILIVRNEPEILTAIDRLLRGLRASLSMVVTTVDQVEVDAETARALCAAEPGGGWPLLLTPIQGERLEAAIARSAARRLGRERIISVEGSGAPRATGEEFRYVADYDVQTNDAQDVSSAVRCVATLKSGATIGLRTVPGYPGSPVYVEIEYERSVLSAMQPFTTPLGPIDLPLTDVWQVATGLRIPDGRTAVVAASRHGEFTRILLVTPHRVASD